MARSQARRQSLSYSHLADATRSISNMPTVIPADSPFSLWYLADRPDTLINFKITGRVQGLTSAPSVRDEQGELHVLRSESDYREWLQRCVSAMAYRTLMSVSHI